MRSKPTTVSPAAGRPRPAQADRRGLSLLELLLVLVLLLGIGALVLPSLHGVQQESAWASDSSRLRSLLERARNAAINRGQPVLVRLEEDGVLRVRPWIGEEDAPAIFAMEFAGVNDGEDELPMDAVLILPDGQARMSGPLVFKGENGRRGAFLMDPLTGRVQPVDPPSPDEARERIDDEPVQRRPASGAGDP